MSKRNTFYHRIRALLLQNGLPPHPIHGWRFTPNADDPTQGLLEVWPTADTLISAQTYHVEPEREPHGLTPP